MTQFFNMKKEYWREHYADALPEGYRRVEYIESTGEQWIDTGVNIKEGLTITGRFKYNGTGLSIIDGRYYVSLSPVSANTIFLLCGGSGTNNQGFYGKAGSGVNMTVSNTNNRWNDFELKHGSLTINGVTASRNEPNMMDGYRTTMYIFAGHLINNPNPGDNVANLYPGEDRTITVAKMNINDTGTMVRTFVPAVRTSDDKPGMYDLCGSISAKTGTPFYVNEGTGADFLWGELS